MSKDIINKIAKRISGFKNNILHYNNAEIIINEIEFIIDYNGNNDTNNLITASTPIYKLNEVKNLMNCKVRETLRKLDYRVDGKDDWRNIGLDIQQVKEIIKNLTESEDVKYHTMRIPYLDEYHHKYELPSGIAEEYVKKKSNSTEIYIKFGILKHKFVVIESFHWNENEM